MFAGEKWNPLKSRTPRSKQWREESHCARAAQSNFYVPADSVTGKRLRHLLPPILSCKRFEVESFAGEMGFEMSHAMRLTRSTVLILGKLLK